MEHTFQEGDRVIVGDATKHVYDVSRCGAIGTINEVLGYGFKVALDEPHLNNCDGVWYASMGDLRHDTDFQVGDWVRYEGVTEFASKEVEGCTGQVRAVNTDSIYADFPKYEFKGAHWRRENLVKIQPPSVKFNDCILHDYPPQEGAMPPYHIGIEKTEEDAIELGIQEKIRLLERQVEKAKCCLETYRDIKRFINKEESHGTR